MALQAADRARIIMDLIRNGDVADETVYRNVDKAPVPVFNRYVGVFYRQQGALLDVEGNRIEFDDLTDEQKGVYYMDALRRLHGSAFIDAVVADAAQLASSNAADNARSDVENDLGQPETGRPRV